MASGQPGLQTTTVKPSLRRQLFGPYLLLKGNRNLGLLLAAHSISRVVQWLYLISLLVLAYQLSGSAVVVALLTLVRILPNALMLPVSGALADRFAPRMLMTLSLGGRAVCMLGFLGVQSRSTLPLAFVSLFGATVLSALFRPAFAALLPSVVDERYWFAANGLATQSDFLSQGVGPAMSGVFVALGDIHLSFLLAAVAFSLSAGCVLLTRIQPYKVPGAETEESWLAYTVEGLKFLIVGHRQVLLALAVSLAGMAVINGANYTLIIFLAEQSFHLGSEGAAYLNAAYGVGGILGGLVLGPLLGRRSIAAIFLVLSLIDCAAFTVLGVSPAGVLPFLLIATGGMMDIATKVVSLSIIEVATARALLARVFGAFESVLMGGQAIGALAAGPAIQILGPRQATVVLSLVGLSALLLSVPWLIRLETRFGVRLFLRQVPVLHDIATTVIDELTHRMALERYNTGDTIIRQGDIGDRFYIVRRGEVSVLAADGSGNQRHVATLSRLDYFGEIALLRDVPRTATIVADKDVEVLSLTRRDFEVLLRSSTEFNRSLQGMTRARDIDLRSKILVTA